MDKNTLYSHLRWPEYQALVKAACRLSGLFSGASAAPYIDYRFVERLFVRCAGATDNSRRDDSFDAFVQVFADHRAGVGVKTFTDRSGGRSMEKVAEFTRLARLERLAELSPEALVYKVAELRRRRVLSDTAANGVNLACSFYHCLVRGRDAKGAYAFVHEESYPLIDLWKLAPQDSQGRPLDAFPSELAGTTVHFTDGCRSYAYSTSKNVLLMRFDLQAGRRSPRIPVEPASDPVALLLGLAGEGALWGQDLAAGQEACPEAEDSRPYVVLPLYAPKSLLSASPQVGPKSGINQWNAGGRPRKFGEAYIPVPKRLHGNSRLAGFFPAAGGVCRPFRLRLPDGSEVRAKLCQEGMKALMSDPNDDLARWLYAMIDGSFEKASLRMREDEANRPYTYEDREVVGKDSVAVLKTDEERFELRLLPLGAARRFWQLEAKGGAPRTIGGFEALLDAQAEQEAQEGQGDG